MQKDPRRNQHQSRGCGHLGPGPSLLHHPICLSLFVHVQFRVILSLSRVVEGSEVCWCYQAFCPLFRFFFVFEIFAPRIKTYVLLTLLSILHQHSAVRKEIILLRDFPHCLYILAK